MSLFDELLIKKYAILQQNADTAAFDAGSNRINALKPSSGGGGGSGGGRGPSTPAFESSRFVGNGTALDGNKFLAGGYSASGGASSAFNTDLTPKTSTSSETLSSSQSQGLVSPGDYSNVQGPAGSPSGPTPDTSSQSAAPEEAKKLKKGIARVPGKGNGTKDTVKAKLAPGEAVLNKAAADGMGRGLISALNKVGARKMGLV